MWGMAGNISVSTTAGGQLQEKIEACDTAECVVQLTVSGPLNGTDIEYLHRCLTNLYHIYHNNSIWTYDCYAFYTYSNNQWVVSAVMK